MELGGVVITTGGSTTALLVMKMGMFADKVVPAEFAARAIT